MIDFVEYIVSQLKKKALSKDEATSLLHQYSRGSSSQSYLHPLLQFNTSDFDQQSYSSRFSGKEFFLRDHKVAVKDNASQMILPAVVYIEMARAALIQAFGVEDGDGFIIALKDVVWLRPLIVEGDIQIHVELFQVGESETEFEIFTIRNNQEFVHCRGSGVLRNQDIATLDFKDIKGKKWDREIQGEKIYSACDRMGLRYGPSWKTIAGIRKCGDGVLAELVLPNAIKAEAHQYFLHPAIADGALQSALALLDDLSVVELQPVLPFSIDQLVFYSPCASKMFAFTRHAQSPDDNKTSKSFDVDIFNEDGTQSIAIRGFTSRTLIDKEAKSSSLSMLPDYDTLLVTSEWELVKNKGELENHTADLHNVVLVNLPETSLPADLPSQDHVTIEHFTSEQESLSDEYEDLVIFCLKKIKTLIEENPKENIIFQLVCLESTSEILRGLEGLLASAHLEHHNFYGQVLLIDDCANLEHRIDAGKNECIKNKNTILRSSEEGLYRKRWRELQQKTTSNSPLWKENGCYLITGGMGGLGYTFAHEILSKVASARVALIGRSELDELGESRLAALQEINPSSTYTQLDITNLDDTRALIGQLVDTHGRVDGILHCAGVAEDELILKSTLAASKRVLAPKVKGTVNIDEATKHIALDFIILFSSAAATGNAGQSAYSSANGFLNAFSTLRNRLVAKEERCGKTLAINWPLWQLGGMQIDDASQTYLYNHYGMKPLSNSDGIKVFYQCFEQNASEVLVASGDQEKLRQALSLSLSSKGLNPTASSNPPPKLSRKENEPELQERARTYFTTRLSELIKLPAADINPFEKLEKYGIDSILITELTNSLERDFGRLSKTLFFEFQTLSDLTDHFLQNHRDKLLAITSIQPKSSPILDEKPETQILEKPEKDDQNSGRRNRGTRRLRQPQTAFGQSTSQEEAIAIVGLSGRYPQSEGLVEFWKNLRDGRDCITEVPKDRWDWQEYFSKDRLSEGCHYSKWGGFIEGVDEFDPLFFNIAPAEAEAIDPQERLFLQHAWMAVEDAGYSRKTLKTSSTERLPGQVGVYVGVMYSEYQLFGAENSVNGRRHGVANSFSSIANRVSYCLDVHGPSIALDTMCSSSLTAIHIACQDLKHQKTHVAIAGGVNVSIHPNKYLILSQGQFISTDGHCQSFGEGGDGYIPGEGVGAVVLKRLSDAQADRNHIYGVIRGSALNHGGKTNGYTVPNLTAQIDVIKQAFDDSGVSPAQVSYIEAHGTGTKLGDPIEIAALTRAFGSSTNSSNDVKLGACELGSVKSNIGHCESAAGIAGLTKILLQMKHRQLVPSLHSKVLNPDIDFSSTPFKVVQEIKAWDRPTVDGKEIARIAGLSSFGAGGANAHVIVEEYQHEQMVNDHQEIDTSPEIILLSARTKQQLEQKIDDLLVHLQDGEIQKSTNPRKYLENLAYTLLVGREHLDQRVGLLVNGLSELMDKLRRLKANESDIEGVFLNQPENNNETMTLFSVDAELKKVVGHWLEGRKFTRLLELWVKGLDIDWLRLYPDATRSLISLPTYPFAKQKYWVTPSQNTNLTTSSTQYIHPLLHVNTSDLQSQRFLTDFTGEEFFLRDHKISINGELKKVLPAVTYLEMAREAISHSIPEMSDDEIIELRNVVWLQPLIVESNVRVFTDIQISESGSTVFRIYSPHLKSSTIYCEGEAVLVSRKDFVKPDVTGVEHKFIERNVDSLYKNFEKLGVKYGSDFRAIQDVKVDESQLSASLVLPQGLMKDLHAYHLHPSMIDSAFQSVMGLFIDSEPKTNRAFIPFNVERVVIYSPCQAKMIANIGLRNKIEEIQDHLTYDIELVDSENKVCIALKGVTSKSLATKHDEKLPHNNSSNQSLILASPSWQPKEPRKVDTHLDIRTHVLVGSMTKIDESKIIDKDIQYVRLPEVHIGNKSLDEKYTDISTFLFRYLKNILNAAPKNRVSLQIISSGDATERTLLSALLGILRTANLESPNLSTKLLFSDKQEGQGWIDLVQRELGNLDDDFVQYKSNERYVVSWDNIPHSDEAYSYTDDGVFLITGGLGGIGKIFASDILEKTRNSLVVLTGRAPLNKQKQMEIESLSSGATGKVIYEELDVTDFEAVERCFQNIASQYRPVTGILHCAGVLGDEYLIKKEEAVFNKVLAPKVAGTINLDRASKNNNLDFFVLFSSVSGVLGNPGQSDYAAANGFMDQFSELRASRVERGERSGRTLSINWPIWQDGGMKIDQEQMELLRNATGIEPLSTINGLQAFNFLLDGAANQVMVLEGNQERIQSFLTREKDTHLSGKTTEYRLQTDNDEADVQITVERYLTQEFSSMLKVPTAELDVKAALEVYGIDSVLAMKLTNQLESKFGPLSKTLFFEYQTIRSLASYFANHHTSTARALSLQQSPAVLQGEHAKTVKKVHSETVAAEKKVSHLAQRFLPATTKQERNDIAIVGVAGRYPMADSVNEFWQNLVAGKDCITEVPSDRWDHDIYFDPQRGKMGKTYSRWGGFLGDVDKFDPLFFSISPKEAEMIDPQERLFLQTAWETIEDAGYSRNSISGKPVGVYVGVMWGQYELYGAQSISASTTSITGSSYASIANRISYLFNFSGPSIAVDTMCSSSLTAIHLACNDIQLGEVEAAIAGGVNLAVHPYKYLNLSQGNFVSSDGKCRSFGEGGDGYVPGEGVGAILLKPLHTAELDGDHIYGIIKSTNLNHGGKTNGYTVPNPIAQGKLIRDSLEKAKIEPKTLSFIEAHGTGTALGDPIEISGLLHAFNTTELEKQSCPIGSVKSNIGHLESAAGIAAVTKAIMQLKHNTIAPSLHANPPNPNIDLHNTPFFVASEARALTQSQDLPARIAISSFGAGGANAHMVLEGYKAIESSGSGSNTQVTPSIFVLSAKDKLSLREYAKKYVAWIDENGDSTNFSDFIYTCLVGRTPLDERLAIPTTGFEHLRNTLLQWLSQPGDHNEVADFLAIEGNANTPEFKNKHLIDGDAGRAFINALIENADFEKLARLWVTGVDVEWATYVGKENRRVSLPTYPFKRERYWVDTQIPASQVESQEVKATPQDYKPEPLERVAYQPNWVSSQLNESSRFNDLRGNVLLLGDFDSKLVEIFESNDGLNITRVRRGEAFICQSQKEFSVRFSNENDLTLLVDHLASTNSVPRYIIHQGSALDLEQVEMASTLTDTVLTDDFMCIFLLTRTLKTRSVSALSLLSFNTNKTLQLKAHQTGLVGFYKTLAQENPRFNGRFIEFVGKNDKYEEHEELSAYLLGELSANEIATPHVRYQLEHDDMVRYQLNYSDFSLPDTVQQPLPLKHAGVYVVTGGLGGIGYQICRELAKLVSAKLAILGRSALDVDRQKKIDHLTSLGAEVLYLQSDIANVTSLRESINTVKNRFSKINGIFHSAGVNDDAFILKKSKASIKKVISAKVHGTINIDLCTQNEEIDIFMLFSSIAGVTGNIGQCDYAYANGFLDEYAHYRESLRSAGLRHGKSISVNWPYWEEGGMDISKEQQNIHVKNTGIHPLPTDIGIALWKHCLNIDSAQIIPLYGSSSAIDRHFQPKGNASEKTLKSPMIKTGANDLLQSTEELLKELIGNEIKLASDKVDVNLPFESFGIDSILIGRINQEFESRLGQLPKTLMYEYESIDALAKFLVRDYSEALQQYFSQTAVPVSLANPEELVAQEIQPQSDHNIHSVKDAGAKVDKIAIIGLHGIYPKSHSLEAFWKNLEEGEDLIEEVPNDRWDASAFYDKSQNNAEKGNIYCKWGGFLQGHDQFDTERFKISPKEAKVIDPQERMFLMSVASLFEDAGYTKQSLAQRFPKGKSADVGVFVGVTSNTYHLLASEEWQKGNYASPGSLPWSIANRVSYCYDLQGPSMPVDTACSSSLVAIDYACESLKRKDCQLAVAGGVNLYLHPAKYHSLCIRGMVSGDGVCASYGNGDDGFIPGEGVGSILLKPLEQAERDGDHIYGVISGYSHEHSGRSNGYSAPNPNSQARVITKALQKASLSAERISYVEGHGTGTLLGDSLEVSALSKAFSSHTDKKQFCALGSVKSNLGHSESAAGITGLTKVLLQLKHKRIAPTIHADPLNPNITFDDSPFFLQQAAGDWEQNSPHPRAALINSFGAGGVNACVAVEEYIDTRSHVDQEGPFVFIISARDEDLLKKTIQNYIDYFEHKQDIDLQSLCYTLQIGREQETQRIAIVFSTLAELKGDLCACLNGKPVESVFANCLGLNKAVNNNEEGGDSQGVDTPLELTRSWVDGDNIDWSVLYDSNFPVRLSLPTSPYRLNRYWISDQFSYKAQPVVESSPSQPSGFHPFVSHNTSTLRQIGFCSQLETKQALVSQHKVNGEPIFPGSGLLEIAYITGSLVTSEKINRLTDIVWASPVSFPGNINSLHTLFNEVKGQTQHAADFEIVSYGKAYDSELHCEGQIHFGEHIHDLAHENYLDKINLLKDKHDSKVSGSELYNQFRAYGLSYGPVYQSVASLYKAKDVALSYIELPKEIESSLDDFVLHPSIIDGAFQSVVGALDESKSEGLYLPFAVEEIQIFGSIVRNCFVYVERKPSTSKNGDIKAFDLTLVSVLGAPILHFKNMYMKDITGSYKTTLSESNVEEEYD